jgi:hypothetical protein
MIGASRRTAKAGHKSLGGSVFIETGTADKSRLAGVLARWVIG